jgi:hypothetical protein
MPATTLADRTLIRLSGEDVHGFLQGLVTADMRQVTAVTPSWAALLSPQGKALFDFILWGDGRDPDGDVFVDCEAEFADELIRRLTLYRLRRPIQLQLVSGLAVHWSPTAPGDLPPESTFGAVSDPRLADLGFRWLAPPDAPAEGWLRHRLSLGVAEGRAELGYDKTLWLECNAAELNGVSFTKGCYVGQENTARMNYRSKVNRRLVVVPSDSPTARARIHYASLRLAVEHRRIDDLSGALIPDWLAAALAGA